MNNSARIRQITDASIITAIYMVILFISRLSGTMLEYEAFFIMPVPMVVYARKYGWKISSIPFVATFALSFFLVNYLSCLTCVLPSLVIGVIYGGKMLNGNTPKWVKYLVLTSVCAAKEILVSIVFSSLLGTENIFLQLQKYAEIASDFIIKHNISFISSTFMASLIEGLVPFFVVGISLIESFLIMTICSLLLPRLKLGEKTNILMLLQPSSRGIPVCYFANIVLMVISVFLFRYDNKILHAFCIIFINSYLLFSLYFLYEFWTFMLLVISLKGKRLLGVLCLLLGFILFPLGALTGALDNLFGFKQMLTIAIISRISESNKNDKED